jgi:hypothetical protein
MDEVFQTPWITPGHREEFPLRTDAVPPNTKIPLALQKGNYHSRVVYVDVVPIVPPEAPRDDTHVPLGGAVKDPGVSPPIDPETLWEELSPL